MVVDVERQASSRLQPGPPRTEERGRLRSILSPRVWPFAILIALALISIASRAWLTLKPLLASRTGF